jgi:hypothetical protein
MRWAGHVARLGERRDVYMVLVGTREGKRPLGRPKRRWEGNKVVRSELFRQTQLYLLTINRYSYMFRLLFLPFSGCIQFCFWKLNTTVVFDGITLT